MEFLAMSKTDKQYPVYLDEIGWFFNEWFYTTKVPDYYVKNLSLKRENGKYLLNFKVIDKNNFTMPLEIEVVTAKGKVIKKVWIINGKDRIST